MIPDRWYPIYDASRLKRGSVRRMTRLGEPLVLWRANDGAPVCMPDRCSHRAAQLSRGKIRRGCLECPYHGLRFDEAGRCVLIPANGADAPVPRGFDIQPRLIREAHGLIWLWSGDRAAASGQQVPWFDNAPEPIRGARTGEMSLEVSHLRVLENMTDFHHVAFVHPWSLAGIGTRATDVEARMEGDELVYTATMRPDLKLNRWRRFSLSAHARVKLPCIASVELFKGVGFVLTATPIDGNATWLWARYAQSLIPWWLGAGLLMRLSALYDWKVVFNSGDYPTLKSQRFEDPADISGYHLFEADRGVSLFFAMYNKALREAGGTGLRHASSAGGR